MSELIQLSEHQYKAVMAITSCFEGDDPVGRYDLIAVLDDGAGISYGKHQATENGGALHRVISRYVELAGRYADDLRPYLDQLYDGEDNSRKFALTNNGAFRQLITDAAQNDILMRQAQDAVFGRDYYLPAIDLCGAWLITLPLGVAMAYEQAIQYGPVAQRALWESWEMGFDPNSYYPQDTIIDPSLPIEVQNQMRTIHHINARMREQRASSRKAAVRKTVYRNDTLFGLMQGNNWLLRPPFEVRVSYHTIQITTDILDRIP